MFVLTTLVYPVVLALLCTGAALLVDRASGGFLPGMLFPAVGAAALIVVSQLSTYVSAIAPATPYLLVAVAVAGLVLGWGRARALAPAWRTSPAQLALLPIAYALALAPVLLAGRPTFSSYTALADSAVHMLGADFLIAHGQNYAHLDLHNSYGLFLDSYYNTSYPSGADTLLGGSTLLLGLPLIWTFQPFTAFMLATAVGPAWTLARRLGLRPAWAVPAALTVTLPALVYGYELVGSVKEIAALPLILCMGALVGTHRRWLWTGARAAIPFALLTAAGVAALGVAFGTWALIAAIVLAAVALADLAHREQSVGRFLGLLAVGLLVLLVGAWPTWVNISGSLHVAEVIASTSNPGNLHSPLRPTQLLGIWLGGNYEQLPSGVALTLTTVLVAFVFALALLGVWNLVRSRWYALAAWFALMIVLWLVLSNYATTWADAKSLMLTSSAAMLIVWAGIAALRASGSSFVRLMAWPLAIVLLGAVLASDALQYNGSNLAPTARYDELASLNTRFAGRGPTLFTDFDEYAMYELRDLDVGGPDFVYPPPALAGAAGGYGRPVALDRVAPTALAAYPLIITRRDPTAERPPAAYRLLWRGTYYQVWGRRPGSKPALAHLALAGTPRAQCLQIGRLANLAGSRHARLVAALAPGALTIPIPRSRLRRPVGWARAKRGILMRKPGTLEIDFRAPAGGEWELWLKGDVMRELRVAIDGRPLGSIAGQIGGNSLVTNTFAPLPVRLSAGPHTLAITRPGADLAPGDGGAAVLSAIFLARPESPAGPALVSVPAQRGRSLCGRRLQWVELVREQAKRGPVARAQ
ncbi:MAG TPA: hypothetical protein VK781_02225 [Solirubrobacteraceae bacterium]|jgi:hypothetical protein|nr:hypothetical protein [Solirubrobacteraceae bacterium]